MSVQHAVCLRVWPTLKIASVDPIVTARSKCYQPFQLANSADLLTMNVNIASEVHCNTGRSPI